jgi:hypothetical protein
MAFNYWEYFLAIESDLTKTTRFVEFNKANFKTYSVEFARILLSASSEVDVLFRRLCSIINSKKSPEKMDMSDFQKIITSEYPKFYELEVLIPRYSIVRKPWKEWAPNSESKLSWWVSYTNVKHYRDKNFKEANLENAIDSVSGLFSVVYYLRKAEKDKTWFSPVPQLVDFKNRRSPGGWGCDWLLRGFEEIMARY